MKLRPYQQKAADSVFKEWEEVNSTMVVLPTGTGKTVLFSDIIRRAQPKRAIVIAHRQELIWQARDKIKAVTGLPVEIEMGEYRSSGNGGLFSQAPVIVSSVQTLTTGGDGAGRIGKFDPDEFGIIICDENHHGTSPSYRKIFNYFKSAKVLGVTATPDRADEQALGQVFETVAYDYEILDAIRDGWLVPVDQQFVNVADLDYSNIRTTAGDLNGADLAAIMEAEEMLQKVASPSIEIIGGRRAIGFTSSVNHARCMCEIFNRHKPGMSAWVCGATPKDERKLILSRFNDGKIQVVWNCAVLTEGFDDPGVEVIIMARPTKSRALYAQMVGRALRPLPGLVDGPESAFMRRHRIYKSEKPSCLVVDFVGNSGKHKLMTTADILGGNVSDEAMESAIIAARKMGKPVRMADSLEEEEQRKTEREAKRLEEEARRNRLVFKASYQKQSVDPFNLLDLKPVKSRGWDEGKVLSEKQKAWARKNGIDPDKLPYAQVKQLLNAMGQRIDKQLCSLNQMKLLKKYGVDCQDVTFEHASRIITSIKDNGWHKPVTLPPAEGQSAQNQAVGAANSPVDDTDNVPF
jgi:superfamily II DNA or RNA helicase